MNQSTIVDFLRHGATQGGDVYRGSTDDLLTELGLQQMYKQCADQSWDRVVSSPLQRCSAFASLLAQQRQLPLQISAKWAEIDFGDWEGQTAEQISRQNPEALQNYYADPFNFTPPNAENYANFSARILSAWNELLNNYAGQQLLIVTHGGVIRTLFSQLLGINAKQSFQIAVPYACLTRFNCFDDAGVRFVQLNFHKPG